MASEEYVEEHIEDVDVEASFEGNDLEALVTRIKAVLDIQDRRSGFPAKTSPQLSAARRSRHW